VRGKRKILRRKATRKQFVVGLAWLSAGEAENAQVYGKENFPYKVAASYAARLWHSQTQGKVGVIMTIVSDKERGSNKDFDDYIRSIEDIPGTVVVTEKNRISDCVLQAQVTRMFAWQNSFVLEDDLIVLADADLFVAGDSVLQMLETPSEIWLGEYSHTESTGGTFPMALTAMSAKDWKLGLDFSTRKEGGPKGLEELVEHFKEVNGETNWGKWEVDQVILSNVIMRPDRQLCSLPKRNPLWDRLNLTSNTFDDTGKCFHGDLMNCYRGNHRWSGCPWWHFLPSDREDWLNKVYTDISETGDVRRPGLFSSSSDLGCVNLWLSFNSLLFMICYSNSF